MSADEILHAYDSAERYKPAGFDYPLELARAARLAKMLARRTGLRAEVDDPSSFQDGTLFTRILLFAPQGDLPGQVLISSFGSMATTYEMNDEDLIGQVASAATDSGYRYIAYDQLLQDYDGGAAGFRGKNWLMRFFCAFHARR